MKKVISLTLTAMLVLAIAAGCSGQSGSVAPSLAEAATASPSAAATPGSEAQSPETAWPTRGISLVVPFKAGGDTDYYARLYAKYLEQELGTTVTVVNTEGAGGTVGAQSVASAAPDGYTILFYHTGNLYANKMLGVSDLDQNSFEIACIGEIDDTNTLVVPASLGVKTLDEFVANSKAEPDKYSCAVTISGFSYYTLCLLQDAAGIKVNPVDAGGAAAMIPALLGDQVNSGINSYGVFKQYVNDGSLIPLMTYGERRSEFFPDVPTARELGYDCAAARAYFFGLPKGTDPAICQKLSDVVAKIQDNQEYRDAVSGTYCVTPQFVPYDQALGTMNDVWAEMEPYTETMNQ